ncbi:MAG TPA: uracil-DNA glycosylase [Planctomycetota bacterium]|nr:uracil-DNA glycosylase [Planctomycetota bacterium]
MAKSLGELFRGIRRCRRCERCDTRFLAVPGEGQAGARMLLLGEAPGKSEDRTGRPFQGRAGNYLDKIFSEHGASRDDAFITGILKCYHPGPPRRRQIEACRPWTIEQIRTAHPKAILVMGRAAAGGLLGMDELGEGEIDAAWEGTLCVVTCHPAAAMRFPKRNAQFRRDFARVLRKLE